MHVQANSSKSGQTSSTPRHRMATGSCVVMLNRLFDGQPHWNLPVSMATHFLISQVTHRHHRKHCTGCEYPRACSRHSELGRCWGGIFFLTKTNSATQTK